jgi:hypothetical protein
VATATFVVGFLTWQVLLPLSLLPSAYRRIGIALLGWQMFAHDHRPPVVRAYLAAGLIDTVPWQELPYFWAVNVGYDRAVIRRLCQAHPTAVRISATTRHPTAPATEWYACGR